MSTGPSTTTDPFLVASEPNVRFVSILTSGDTPPGDDGPFGGIPDGLGAFDNGDGTITVLVNHELGSGSGLTRDHGATGAYIDRLTIDKATLAVVSQDDLIKTTVLSSGANAFNRFCSGDLPATTALYNSATGLGTQQHIYLTGEENTPEGRPTATIVTGPGAGTLYELTSLGNMAYENIVANPYQQNKTVVAMTDDQSPTGQVYIYVGEKTNTGTEIQKAGLVGGDFYGIKVTGFSVETNGTPINGTFTLDEIGPAGDVSSMNGSDIESESNAEGVTRFLRPEDFAWDPDHPNVAYFVTTNAFGTDPATTPTRLYKMTFTDITNPQAGGTIEAVIDGTEGFDAHMFDNITVADGKVIIQEDPGNQGYVAKIWEYDIAADKLAQVGNFDPAKFTPGASGFITQDEESSGLLDVTSLLGDADTRAYLLDAQVHAPSGNPATVEQGQLMVMYIDDPFLIGGNANDDLFGSSANETMRGGNGNDTAHAGSGDDQLYGNNGADVLIGGAGDDLLSGGNGADYFVMDNRGETGSDDIIDFAKPDHLLVTVQLADANQDGIIELDAGGTLELFGASDVTITNNGTAATALHFDGTVTLDGLVYYSYDLDGGNIGLGHAAGHLADLSQGHANLF